MLFYYRRLPLRDYAMPLLFLVITFFGILSLFAPHAYADNISPTGIGDLMPSPSSPVPKGQGTLYESYSNPNLWQLDTDYGTFDVTDPMLETVADICMALISVIGAACVVVVQWIFELTSIPALENAITKSIGGASAGLTTTLLPSAIAVGALIAFVNHKKGGGNGGMSQLAWVLISAIISVSLLTTPGAWVGGIDTARQVGSNITLSATSAGLGDGTQDFPFKLDHTPKFTGNGRDDMLRKSSDAVWRAYVATPWCVAEFGSLEVCQKFGEQLLNQGTDADTRKTWLQNNVTTSAVGKDSVKWRQGHNPVGRIMVTVPCLISVIIFAALILMLCFGSLASLLGALMLLLTGVIFACLWVIPGKPRQWGLAWFDQLLGRTLESLIATLVLGAVLSLQAATTEMFGTYGWLPSSGLAIAVAIVGFKFRTTVAQIFGVSTGGSSMGALAGFLGARALGKLGGKLLSGGKSSSHDPQPVRTLPKPEPPEDPMPGGTGYALAVRPPYRPPAPNPGPPRPPRPRSGDEPPVVTLERTDRPGPPGKEAAKVPPNPGRRPALPASREGGGEGASREGTTESTPGTSAGGSSSVPPVRPGSPHNYRQAPPPPGTPAPPRVVQGEVIRSEPAPRPASPPPPPARTTAPARSVTPSMTPEQRARAASDMRKYLS